MGTESTDRERMLYTSIPSASGKVHVAKEVLREMGLIATDAGIKVIEKVTDQISN